MADPRPLLATLAACGLLALAGCGSQPEAWTLDRARQELAAPTSEENRQAAWNFAFNQANGGDAEAMYLLAEQFGQANDSQKMSEWLGKAARAGNAKAQTDLALMVLSQASSGKVSKDQVVQATVLLEQAAAQNEPRALDQLGTLHVATAANEFELDEAVGYFRRAVELGYAPSMVRLATLHFAGKGVEKDTQRGIGLLQRAAEAGDESAAFRLAQLYQMGGPVEKDLKQARLWLEKAAANPTTAARFQLAVFYLQHEAENEALVREALQFLRTNAEGGHAGSQYLLARCYLMGQGVPMNPDTAAQWFRLAANNGHVDAATSLAVLLAGGVGPKAEGEVEALLNRAAEGGDPRAHFLLYQKEKQKMKPGDKLNPVALQRLQTAADARIPQALYDLGLRRLNGDGVDRDGADGYRLLTLAGAKGHAGALRQMGELFRDGGTTVKDPAKALALMQLAAKQGDEEAALQAGLMLEQSDDPAKLAEARQLYEQAAAKGNATAKGQLARLMLRTPSGNAASAEALPLLQTAHNEGDMQATWLLGDIHEHGKAGQPRDPVKAAGYYREARRLGSEDATFRLVYLIETEGTAIGTPDEAVNMLRSLARSDYPGALAMLGKWHLDGHHVRKDLLAAIQAFRQGAEEGDAECLYQLGLLYEAGRGVETDPIRAAKYYREAAEQNHPGAMNNLGVMYQHGYGVGQNKQQARELLQKAKAAGHPQAAQNLQELN